MKTYFVLVVITYCVPQTYSFTSGFKKPLRLFLSQYDVFSSIAQSKISRKRQCILVRPVTWIKEGKGKIIN